MNSLGLIALKRMEKEIADLSGQSLTAPAAQSLTPTSLPLRAIVKAPRKSLGSAIRQLQFWRI
jgi:hypothetical protein